MAWKAGGTGRGTTDVPQTSNSGSAGARYRSCAAVLSVGGLNLALVGWRSCRSRDEPRNRQPHEDSAGDNQYRTSHVHTIPLSSGRRQILPERSCPRDRPSANHRHRHVESIADLTDCRRRTRTSRRAPCRSASAAGRVSPRQRWREAGAGSTAVRPSRRSRRSARGTRCISS